MPERIGRIPVGWGRIQRELLPEFKPAKIFQNVTCPVGLVFFSIVSHNLAACDGYRMHNPAHVASVVYC